MANCIFVLGFHRSGTSALAGCIRAMGVDGGQFEDQPSEENPRGFNEHPMARAINDKILTEVGSAWFDWSLAPGFIAEAGDDLRTFRDWICDFLRAHYRSSGNLILKDPRFCYTLPVWLDCLRKLGIAHRIVFISRDPDYCVDSQMIRSQRDPNFYRLIQRPESVYALWLNYMAHVQANLPKEQALFVLYDDLLDQTQAEVSRLARYLSDVAEVDEASGAAVFSKALRRSSKKHYSTALSECAQQIFSGFERCGTPGEIAALFEPGSEELLAQTTGAFAAGREFAMAAAAHKASQNKKTDARLLHKVYAPIMKQAVRTTPKSEAEQLFAMLMSAYTTTGQEPFFWGPIALTAKKCGKLDTSVQFLERIIANEPGAEWAVDLLERIRALTGAASPQREAGNEEVKS